MARGAILPETMVSGAGKPPPANRGGRAYGSGIMQPNADVNDVRYLYLMKDCGGRNGVALPRAVPSMSFLAVLRNRIPIWQLTVIKLLGYLLNCCLILFADRIQPVQYIGGCIP